MAPAHQLISSLFGNLSSRTMYDPTMEEPVAGKVANVIVTVVASSLCFAFFCMDRSADSMYPVD